MLKGEGGLKRKAFSGIMLTLMLMGISTLVFYIQPVKGEMSNPEVAVFPEHPTTDDFVNVSVSFWFSSDPPGVREFGPLVQVGNTFSVNVTVWVPAPGEVVFWIVHTDYNTYGLGKLSGGVYQFQVYVYYQHYAEGTYYLAKSISFTVTPPPVGGKATPINKVTTKPMNNLELLAPYTGLTILLAVAVVTVGYVKKREKSRVNS